MLYSDAETIDCTVGLIVSEKNKFSLQKRWNRMNLFGTKYLFSLPIYIIERLYDHEKLTLYL